MTRMKHKIGRVCLIILMTALLAGWGQLGAQDKEAETDQSPFKGMNDYNEYLMRKHRVWESFISLDAELKITREEYSKLNIWPDIMAAEQFKKKMSGPRILLAQEMLKDKPDMAVIENLLKTLQGLEYERNLAEIKKQIRYREVLGTERWAALARFARNHRDQNYYSELLDEIYWGAGAPRKDSLGGLHMFLQLCMLGLEPDQ